MLAGKVIHLGGFATAKARGGESLSKAMAVGMASGGVGFKRVKGVKIDRLRGCFWMCVYVKKMEKSRMMPRFLRCAHCIVKL